MAENQQTLKGKLILEGKIRLLTGMHIGGTKETLKIGGTDNPVIKDKFDNVLIPGSSLKGKIRALLEKVYGTYKRDENNKKEKKPKNDGKPCECGLCEICKLFGPHQSNNIEDPVRVIVRDAYLEPDEGKNHYDYLEIKVENTIDRIKGTTVKGGVRNTERVVAGSKFKFEIVFNIYNENDIELIKKFIEGMKLLEDDYLGGSGSRGYGKIKFEEMKWINKPREYYEGKETIKDSKVVNDLDELLNELLDNKDKDNMIWTYSKQ
ncbi:type III-A CRISPR-associated RAMP protein Csm3 [Methanocaldococcus indicus]|uniref:type III-A CRISPR-associated RAMP protein Csm3 n=1 Tax=Methanocaldococcus indicus TaxID=213231 RepID=UPI003C6DB319